MFLILKNSLIPNLDLKLLLHMLLTQYICINTTRNKMYNKLNSFNVDFFSQALIYYTFQPIKFDNCFFVKFFFLNIYISLRKSNC